MNILSEQNVDVERVIRQALEEDIGAGDATSASLTDGRQNITARMRARQACRMAGAGVAAGVFRIVAEEVKCEIVSPDGACAEENEVLLTITGPAAAVLTAERTALNFVQRMAGIATQTHRFVEAVKHTDAVILDTRKTMPGLRVLDKYAVTCGGGHNHRMGLYDRIMLKDNHLAFMSRHEQSYAAAVASARKHYPELLIEIEIDTAAQLDSIVPLAPDWILLDNMPPEVLKDCVRRCREAGIKTEASGGITLDTVASVAETGVDAVSVGALTHSVQAVDIGLDFM